MEATILQCKQCRRLYQSISAAPYCPHCVEKLEKKFELVKNYIYEHPNANVVEISEETGVSEKDIFYFLKEGRLSISEDNGMLLCESCGHSITTGRYCEACNKKLERELSASVNESMQKLNQSTGIGKMHVDFRKR